MGPWVHMDMRSDFPLYLLHMLYSHVLLALIFFLVLLVSALARRGYVGPMEAMRTFCT
jgi:hypothetical protein